jgi:hypothetical protein
MPHSDASGRLRVSFLPAAPFFAGVVAGFVACCILGRVAASHFVFADFERFFKPIQPQTFFYPTASELLSHVRHTVPKDKTLVLVGGASYFRGYGQNRDDLWTLDLQRRLGPGHAVVNFAIDAAAPTDFAGAMYQVLWNRYPKVDYVANIGPTEAPTPDGGPAYRYVFWDAYYKGLLPAVVSASPAVRKTKADEMKTSDGEELHLGKWLDAWTYSCDLWTYVGYHWLFTVWSWDGTKETPFKARKDYHEAYETQFLRVQREFRDLKDYDENSENSARLSAHHILSPAEWADTRRRWNLMFPPALRARCFLVLVRGNPYFMRILTAAEHQSLEDKMRTGAEIMEELGYSPIQFPTSEFTQDDFLDGGHFVASGGRKVARGVEAAIQQVEAAGGLPSGPVRVKLALPANGERHAEPLLTLAAGGKPSEQILIDYLDANHVRLGYRDRSTAGPLWSDPLPTGLAQTDHTLEASLSGLYPMSEAASGPGKDERLEFTKRWVVLNWDHAPTWGLPVRAMDENVDRLGFAGFSGRIEEVSRIAPAAVEPATIPFGGARLRINVDPGMVGRALPLATTGKYGGGDALFVRFLTKSSVQFGYDHWNDPTAYSPVIPLQGAGHVIDFWLPAILLKASGPLTVKVDGRTVWTAQVAVHKPTDEEIYFGWNPMGFTTCEPDLDTGTFESVTLPSP